jgi:hypothetical protein
MVRIKFTAHPRTPVVSPKFGLMALDEALEASAKHKETSTKQLEESQGGQHVVVSTKTTLELDAGFDQENQSEGSSMTECGGIWRPAFEEITRKFRIPPR